MEKQLKENKRSPRKRIVNFLVHVLLAVLALIWVMPIVWIDIPAQGIHAEQLCEAPYGQERPELPADVQKHADHRHLQLLHQHIVRAVCVVFAQPDAFQIP